MPLSRIVPAAVALALAGGARPALARIELGYPAGQADVTVGCMFPMTGRSAIYGKDSVGGIRLALERIAAETAGGRPPRLRVLVDDSGSKASSALRLAEDFLHREHARFLCGVVSSGVGQAVSRFASTREVIFIGTDHASSRLTIEDFHDHYFRVSNDTYSSMAAGALYLADLQRRSPWKRIAFLGSDYDYGHVAMRDLRDALARLGVRYEAVGEFWPRLYEPDYSAYVQAVRAVRPDVLVVALWGADFIAFLKQAAATDLLKHVRLANFDTGGNYDVMVALGDDPPPGLILSARHHNNWPDTPLNREFVEGFRRLEGRYPTYAAEGAYSGIVAIAGALRRAGGKLDTASLVKALEGLEIALPEDPPGFTSRIDPDSHQIAQFQAVGEVVPDDRFPPARVMLGHWVSYEPDQLKPSPDEVRSRRDRARSVSHAVQ